VLAEWIFSDLSIKTTELPSYGSTYAVTGGKYLGEFFVFMEIVGNDHTFLSLPDMKIRSVPKDKLITGIEHKVLQFQEILPINVLQVCKAQYEKSKTNSKSYN